MRVSRPVGRETAYPHQKGGPMANNASITRRGFVGAAIIGGTAAAFCAAGPTARTALADDKPEQDESHSLTTGEQSAERPHEQMGFLVNTGNCVDCGCCEHACRRANGIAENEPSRRRIQIAKHTTHDIYISTSCMHCLNPSCMAVCPAGAISKREQDGIVVVDQQLCIGCKYCYQACPFEVPRYTSRGMDKCDYCIGQGRYPNQPPACAAACPHEALFFGTIEELQETALNNGRECRSVTGITGPSLLIQ